MEAIKDLYYRYFNQSDEYFERGDMPEVNEVWEQFRVYEARLGFDEYAELECAVADIHLSCEMQGWVYGYMFAMRMLGECGVKVGGSV